MRIKNRLIKNRTDIPVPPEYVREFKVDEDAQGQELADAIIDAVGNDWSWLDLTQTCTELGMEFRSNLREASLTGISLHKANLREAMLDQTDLTDVNLTEANLYRTGLVEANVTRTDFTGASLNGVSMSGAMFLATAKHDRILPIDFPNEFGLEIAVFASHRLGSELLALGPTTVHMSLAETTSEELMNWLLPGSWYFWRDKKAALLSLAKEKLNEFRAKGA